MKHNKKTKILFILMLFLQVLHPITVSIKVDAQELSLQPLSAPRTEIIFLLDSSQSMEETDKELNAPDFIRQMDLSLPGNYQTGFVSYNTSIVKVIGLDGTGEGIVEALKETAYSGYTNVGAGLQQARELFSDNPDTTRKILLISDGEIDMASETETQAAIELFDEAIREIQNQGIAIDVMALGSLVAEDGTVEQGNINKAAKATGGNTYIIEDAENLPDIAASYLLNECRLPIVGIGKMSGREAELPIVLPDAYMDTAKILLFGQQQDAHVNVSGKTEEMRVEQGAGFTVISLDKPQQKDFTLQIASTPDSQQDMDITAYLTAEYSLAITASNQYRPEDGNAYFKLDIINQEGNSLLDGHLKDRQITVSLDGQERQVEYRENQIQVVQAIPESREILIEVSLPETYAYYKGVLKAVDTVEVPPPPPPEEPPRIEVFPIAAIFLLVLSIIFLLVWAKRKRRYLPRQLARDTIASGEGPSADGAYLKSDFWGKAVIYVVNSNDGIDYRPESINLAAQCSRDTITLQWMLDICAIPLLLKDADKIIFRAGEGKSLSVKNSGRATALKGRDVLAKHHSYSLYFHEKVTFIFDNDGTDPAEIEVHYNDLQINER